MVMRFLSLFILVVESQPLSVGVPYARCLPNNTRHGIARKRAARSRFIQVLLLLNSSVTVTKLKRVKPCWL